MTNYTKIIIDHCFEYASNLLTDTGQCYPFGAFVDKAGVVHPLEFEIEDKKNMPNNETVINGLKKYCETQLSQKKIRAYGLTYEASVQLKIDENSIDTIAIDIIESNGEVVPIYYFPYKFTSENIVEFSETFAVAR